MERSHTGKHVLCALLGDKDDKGDIPSEGRWPADPKRTTSSVRSSACGATHKAGDGGDDLHREVARPLVHAALEEPDQAVLPEHVIAQVERFGHAIGVNH